MTPTTRAELALAQTRLLEALDGRAAPDEGFDPERVAAAGKALARKRARSVARAWPALTAALGDAFPARFAAFAARTPLPAHGGPLADGRAFARALAAERALPEEALLEVLSCDVHAGRHLVLRRAGRRAGLAVRVPGLPARAWTFPLPGILGG